MVKKPLLALTLSILGMSMSLTASEPEVSEKSKHFYQLQRDFVDLRFGTIAEEGTMIDQQGKAIAGAYYIYVRRLHATDIDGERPNRTKPSAATDHNVRVKIAAELFCDLFCCSFS